MKRKIDSTIGRVIYGMRLAISEPPFSHITSALKLDRFHLTGQGESEHAVESLLHCAQFNKDTPLWAGVCLTDGYLGLNPGQAGVMNALKPANETKGINILSEKINQA